MNRFRTPLALLALTLLAACATQVPATVAPGAPGFLFGLWHGWNNRRERPAAPLTQAS